MNLICSVDENWGIGKKNRLLYRIPPDMRNFKEKTLGGAVVMGRKTWESLPGGQPLSGRANIVLTGNPTNPFPRKDYQWGGDEETREEAGGGSGLGRLFFCASLSGLPAVLKEAKLSPDETWVMGGAEIYALFMPYCREAHVTRISACDPEADCWMVNLDAAIGWERIEKGILQEWGGLHFRYDRYRNGGTIGLPIG